MKKKSGFTLLELIIVLALISIVMAFAIPSMQTFTQNDRLTTNINTLIGHLAYARSEAVKRSSQIAMCASADGATCGGGSWVDGWIVYIDADQDNSLSAGEEILRVHEALDSSQVASTGGLLGLQVVYDYRGFVDANSVGALQLCDNRTGPHGKTIRITNTGRVRLETDSIC